MRRGLFSHTQNASGKSKSQAGEEVLSVSALTRRIRNLLEGELFSILVEGEIGSLKKATSGHIYLTLKDAHAVIDVVMWRSSASRLGWTPREGDKVLVRGEITVYEPRGRYQLVASSLRPVGQGELQRRFEEMVRKLQEEGLFEPTHKKSLPPLPSVVGLVTSPTGAAVRDMIKVMRRRMASVKIVVSPCIVQGDGAAAQIVSALQRLERWGKCDVIIVGRGGGSLEDLWAFNEEPVARAIFACQTPIISAVGHEVDITISDLVADMRAATPSEAAETVVPDQAALHRRAALTEVALHRNLQRTIQGARLRYATTLRHLAHSARASLAEARGRLRSIERASVIQHPERLLRQKRQILDDIWERLQRIMTETLEADKNRLRLLAAQLESLSPLSVLSRGYSVTLAEDGKSVLRNIANVRKDDTIQTRLPNGTLLSRVMEVQENNGEEKK